MARYNWVGCLYVPIKKMDLLFACSLFLFLQLVFLNLLLCLFFFHSDELVMLQQCYDTSLLLVCMQMIVILTKSVNRCFEKNPKFDMTPLLGGTDIVFSSLIHSFSWFVSLL